jgi:hypothetical protein
MEENIRRQEEELAVLKAIYQDDLDVVRAVHPLRLRIKCYPYTEDEEDRELYCVLVLVDFPRDYPLSGRPFFELHAQTRLTQTHISKL